jgi:hypothetical protein
MIARVASSLALLFASTAMAAAAEVCVACVSPDITYRCAVEKAEKLEQLPEGQRVLERICTKMLAKSGSHAKCAVSREAPACTGDLKTIGVAELKDAIAAASINTNSDSKVEGLLPGAYRVTTEGLQKTGEAIGGGAKTAWDCVASLFSEC